jgi:hypothetical protein
MEVQMEIPQFTSDRGIEYKWENGFSIEIKIDNGIINIIANKAGLISLAGHFLNLAQTEVPKGHHLHFDEYNSLEIGSSELIVQKQGD